MFFYRARRVGSRCFPFYLDCYCGPSPSELSVFCRRGKTTSRGTMSERKATFGGPFCFCIVLRSFPVVCGKRSDEETIYKLSSSTYAHRRRRLPKHFGRRRLGVGTRKVRLPGVRAVETLTLGIRTRVTWRKWSWTTQRQATLQFSNVSCVAFLFLR